jgi:hypothetical protein
MRAYLVTRSYHALGTASRQLTQRLEGLATRVDLDTAAQRCPSVFAPLVAKPSGGVLVNGDERLYVRKDGGRRHDDADIFNCVCPGHL